MTQRPPDRGPLAVLLACSSAVAVVVALANVASLVAARDVARLRDLRPLVALRTELDAVGVMLFRVLPSGLHAPFDLQTAASVLVFTALAVLVYVTIVGLAAALAAPLVIPLVRAAAPQGRRWSRGFPLAILAAALVPIVAHRLTLWTGVGGPALALASLAAAALAWWLARALVRSDAAVERLVAIAGWIGVVGTTLAALGVVAAAATNRGGPPRVPPPVGAPNVLLISIDTLRPDHLGCYGYARDTSPALDALARAGARFTTVVSPTSWTLPAHVTLLTALPPEIHGVVEDRFRLGARARSLAEVLRARGYATAGFVSGPYLDAAYGFDRGFDVYDDYSAVHVAPSTAHRARTSPALLTAIDTWLDRRDADESRRPFFVFVHMWDVHYDFNPPPPYDRMFDPDYRGSISDENFETGTSVHSGMDPRDLLHVVALYDGEIRYTDEYVGRLVDSLGRRRRLDDTVIVVTADHGEEFYEHGNKGHHKALYDESIRVPLIVRYPPRVPAHTVVDRQVRLLDVAPTILALTDTPAPADFGVDPQLADYAGRSLVALLTEPASPAPVPPAFASIEPYGLRALRGERHKLLQAPLASPAEQLFDLAADPGERTNLAPTEPATAAALRSELDTWTTTARRFANERATAATSEDHKAALRALGYVE